jgi:hypothetical protein
MAMSSSEEEPIGESSGPPSWDQEKANQLPGKNVIVGITRLVSDGKTVKSQTQYHGKVASADRQNGFKIICEGAFAGETLGLPPDLRLFQRASPGEYKLRSTGEIVNDPDFLVSCSIVEPSKH